MKTDIFLRNLIREIDSNHSFLEEMNVFVFFFYLPFWTLKRNKRINKLLGSSDNKENIDDFLLGME